MSVHRALNAISNVVSLLDQKRSEFISAGLLDVDSTIEDALNLMTTKTQTLAVQTALDIGQNVREECLTNAEHWFSPTANEVQTIVAMTGLKDREIAQFLGLAKDGDRTVRRWTSGESRISYSAWALLCERAGLGCIWKF